MRYTRLPAFALFAAAVVVPAMAAAAPSAVDLLSGTRWAMSNPLHKIENMTAAEIAERAKCDPTRDLITISSSGEKIFVLKKASAYGVEKTTYDFGRTTISKNGGVLVALFYGGNTSKPSVVYEVSADGRFLTESGSLFGAETHIRCADNISAPQSPGSQKPSR